MFVLCHGWLLIVRELLVSPWALVSYALQQALVWLAYWAVDSRLDRRTTRFAWAGLATLYATATLLDATLMRMTSLPLREILPMLIASQNMIEGLREIGLKPWRLAVLASLLLMAAIAGGTARLILARFVAGRTSSAGQPVGVLAGAGLLVCVGAGFGSEQMLARDQPDYLYRGFRMPAYAQLYSTSSKSHVVPLPRPIAHEQRQRWLDQIAPAKNPKHVLYVLLESFRADAVTPAVSPTISALARDSVRFDHALAEATYTPLSWSVLLFDEAAHDNLFGRHPGRSEPLGSWLLAVMRRAGYEPHVYVSTNLTYARTRERLLGKAPSQLDFFQAASDVGDDPSDKNDNDRVAVDHALQFIEQTDWQKGPQFLLLQLDSTHYTYPFPETHAVFRPYSETLTLPRPIETAQEATLLQNRYRNAAHYVDEQVGRLVAALKRAGVYDDMVVVLTADHGEGLTPGMQGHAAVFEATRHVPLLFKLPGQAPRTESQLISHRDILPTLAEYLGIDMPAGSTRGRAASQGASPGVLTLAPSGRFGQFITGKHVVDLRLLFDPDRVTLTPAGNSAHESDERTKQWLPLLAGFLQTQHAAP
ncbi:MAG TPA: sulfatase-like hydrolase/transferase [Polyangiales bacterium]|nr:sulfatase-like hydrolase/transferase [Polyangiales bacterium]